MVNATRPVKDVGVDTLRGLAILLVVSYHVIGGDAASGFQVPDGSGWRTYTRSLEDVRMPLFTTISGFVYALRPLKDDVSLIHFVRGKGRRLLVPLIFVGTAFFIVQLLAPGTNRKPEADTIWRIYVFPFEQFWFLQAVFLIFVVVALLERRGLTRKRSLLLWSIVLSAALHVITFVPAEYDVFSISGAVRLMPFFLIGCALAQYAPSRRVTAVVVIFTICVYGLRLGSLLATEAGPIGPSERAFSFAAGASAVTALFLVRRTLRNPLLAWVGQFAFGIYLLHNFANAATRILLEQVFGVRELVALFPLVIVAAVGVPILFELTVGKQSTVSRLVLGQKPSRPRTLAQLRSDSLR